MQCILNYYETAGHFDAVRSGGIAPAILIDTHLCIYLLLEIAHKDMV